MCHYNHSLSIDATIMVSKHCPITGEHVGSLPGYQKYGIKKNFTAPFLKYKRLKLKLRVFLADRSVAMVTYSVTKIIPTCSPVIGQCFDTMIVASTDTEW